MIQSSFPRVRPRRLRSSSVLRRFVEENHVLRQNLVLPLFIKEGITEKKMIQSMPGCFQLPLKQLADELRSIQQSGVCAVMLFGIPQHKDSTGSAAWSEHGVIQQAIGIAKEVVPDLLVMADLCFCEYTEHGHCGVVKPNRFGVPVVHNDATLELLGKQAHSLAQAGADIIAPSGMMDGAIQTIRSVLDRAGYEEILLLSYAVKYASALYGPFREAAENTPEFGDRKTYQMNSANAEEAVYEAGLDIQEGADMVLIKPGHTYLDIILRVKQCYPHVPVGAYHPSGEFALLKAAASHGWIDEREAVHEVLLAMKRAGAQFIITYYAQEYCSWNRNS